MMSDLEKPQPSETDLKVDPDAPVSRRDLEVLVQTLTESLDIQTGINEPAIERNWNESHTSTWLENMSVDLAAIRSSERLIIWLKYSLIVIGLGVVVGLEVTGHGKIIETILPYVLGTGGLSYGFYQAGRQKGPN